MYSANVSDSDSAQPSAAAGSQGTQTLSQATVLPSVHPQGSRGLLDVNGSTSTVQSADVGASVAESSAERPIVSFAPQHQTAVERGAIGVRDPHTVSGENGTTYTTSGPVLGTDQPAIQTENAVLPGEVSRWQNTPSVSPIVATVGMQRNYEGNAAQAPSASLENFPQTQQQEYMQLPQGARLMPGFPPRDLGEGRHGPYAYPMAVGQIPYQQQQYGFANHPFPMADNRSLEYVPYPHVSYAGHPVPYHPPQRMSRWDDPGQGYDQGTIYPQPPIEYGRPPQYRGRVPASYQPPPREYLPRFPQYHRVQFRDEENAQQQQLYDDWINEGAYRDERGFPITAMTHTAREAANVFRPQRFENIPFANQPQMAHTVNIPVTNVTGMRRPIEEEQESVRSLYTQPMMQAAAQPTAAKRQRVVAYNLETERSDRVQRSNLPIHETDRVDWQPTNQQTANDNRHEVNPYGPSSILASSNYVASNDRDTLGTPQQRQPISAIQQPARGINFNEPLSAQITPPREQMQEQANQQRAEFVENRQPANREPVINQAPMSDVVDVRSEAPNRITYSQSVPGGDIRSEARTHISDSSKATAASETMRENLAKLNYAWNSAVEIARKEGTITELSSNQFGGSLSATSQQEVGGYISGLLPPVSSNPTPSDSNETDIEAWVLSNVSKERVDAYKRLQKSIKTLPTHIPKLAGEKPQQ